MGLLTSWKPYVQGVCAHEHLPTYDKFWDDYVKEEISFGSCSTKEKEK